MSTSLTLDTARRPDGKIVLAATGEIDPSNIEMFAQAVSTALADAAGSGRRLIVDLSGVEYLDSAAISVLFPHAERMHLVAQPLLMRILDISGLTELAAVECAPTDSDH